MSKKTEATSEEVVESTPSVPAYAFPGLGVTVEASSLQEANEKVKPKDETVKE